MDHRLMDRIYRRFADMPHHHGIVPLRNYQFHRIPYYTITEFDEGTRLSQISKLPRSKTWEAIIHLAEAMDHAHKHGVFHGNLHPGNVYFSEEEDESIRLRVADFGAGMIGEVHHVDLGDNAYFAPPEQLLCLGKHFRNGNAERWDVYRFGALAYWLLHRAYPRGKGYAKERKQKLAESGGRPVPVDPAGLAGAITQYPEVSWNRRACGNSRQRKYKKVIKQCLEIDPAKRPVDMREVSNLFQQIDSEAQLAATQKKAKADLSEAESRVSRERLKQRAKLFSARASATILAASCIVAVFYLVAFFRKTEESKSKINHLDQVVANQQAHISILGNKNEAAEGDLKQSREAADASFYSMMRSSSQDAGHGEAAVHDLERSRTYYIGVLKEISQNPEAVVEKGRALHSLAHIEHKLTRLDEAVDHYRTAVDAFETSLKSQQRPLDETARQDTVMRLADCYECLAELRKQPWGDEALELHSNAVWYLKQVLLSNPDDTNGVFRLAENNFQLGQILEKSHQFEEAVSAFASAAEQAKSLQGKIASDELSSSLEWLLIRSQFQAARALQKLGRTKESVDAFIATVESLEKRRGAEGFNREETVMMAKSFIALGDVFRDIEKIEWADKDQVYNEALRIVSPANRNAPRDLEVAIVMCDALSRLAKLQGMTERWELGYDLSLRGIETLKTAVEQHPGELDGQIRLVRAKLDHLRFREKRPEPASALALQGVDAAVEAHRLFVASAAEMPEPVRRDLTDRLRGFFGELGVICRELGEAKAAAKCASFSSFKVSSSR